MFVIHKYDAVTIGFSIKITMRFPKKENALLLFNYAL